MHNQQPVREIRRINRSASAGQTSSSNYQIQSGSQQISVVAESSVNVPFKLALVNPSGLTLQTVDASNGTAVLSASITQSGIYVRSST